MENKKLNAYLSKRQNQGTVILCFKILLENIILNDFESTMTKAEIHKEFDAQHQKFGIGTFRSDYLLRQSASSNFNAIGVKKDNATFFINPEFLMGVSKEGLKAIIDEINDHFGDVIGKQQRFLNEIESNLSLSIDERKKFIADMLLNRETEKKGQTFEVTSFAILKTFYKIRGFELNRFSTVYANDGGIDFTSQSAVYQVTTNLSSKKFEEDLKKAPLKKRIFVYKKETSSFEQQSFDDELVLDYISSEDLIQHLEYLFRKKSHQNSTLIINEIISEFKREYYME